MSYTLEVANQGEVRFRSYNGDGSVRNDGRLRLAHDANGNPQPVQWLLTNLFPQPIAIGATGRDEHPFAASNTRLSGKQGVGLLYDDPGQPERVSFATTDLRYARQITLPKKKIVRTSPSASKTPRAGTTFNDRIYVVFDQDVYKWDETIASWSGLLGTLPAVPQGEPILYGSYLYWCCGASGIVRMSTADAFVTYTNATINGAVGGAVYNAKL
jgi:hypothetical protein